MQQVFKKTSIALGIAAVAAIAGASVFGLSGGGGAGKAAIGGAPAPSLSGEGTLNQQQRYIVVYREAPLSAYKGELNGLAAPKRLPSAVGGAGRIDVQSAAARSYVQYLGGVQADHERRIHGLLGRSPRVDFRMRHALNGIVTELTAAEADRISQLDEVRFVEPYQVYEQATDVGPGLIGAPALWNATPTAYRGEGMVIGIIDSGINFGSPAFTAVDDSGYHHVNPLGAGTYLGSCAPGGVDEGRCNDKLIGGYDFVCAAPGNQCGVANVREEPGFGDTNSHGSHVASTAAGNAWNTTFRGNNLRISGVAPHANIIAYDACYTEISTGRGLCPNTSTVRSIDQAIADGVVDVINYSIGGGSNPWGEATSLSFLNATDAGIYVAAAAGNDGPDSFTSDHLEPWVGTTAASQHGRGSFEWVLAISGPGAVPGALQAIELTEGSGGTPFAVSLPSTTPVRVSAGIDSANDGCAAFPANTFQGAIAVVRRGTCNFTDKVANAAAAGAVAVVIANNQITGLSPSVPGATVPAFVASQADSNALRNFAASNGNTATGGIPFPAVIIHNTPDQLADFSSRGPAADLDLVKPDITAPGVDVLAVTAGTAISGSEQSVGLLSGTSMASPHHAGAAALVRQARPTWTVAEVKSALMMTAKQEVLKEDGVTQADAHAMGAGRIQVDQAIRAGLVLNETKANYAAANPATGGQLANLNLPSMAKFNCAGSCSFTRVVRNTLSTRQTWTGKVQGLSALVSPSLFTLNPGETKSIKITVSTNGLPQTGAFNFGKLVLTPSGGDASQPVLRLPIAVAVQPPKLDATPAATALSLPAGGTGSVALRIGNIGGSNLDWQIDNTGTGSRTLVATVGNGANGTRSTRFTDAATVGARAVVAADDFTLADATAITQIRADGFVNGGTLATAQSINWSIFRDVGGNPEGNPESTPQLAVWSYTAAPTAAGVSTSGFATINLNLATAGQNVNLAAGRYWLVVSVRAPLATSWFWFNATSGDSIYRSVLVLPDGSGAWSALTGSPGLAYGLQGANNCGATWIGAPTRAFGRVAPAAGMDTQVQINAAGLAAGSYVGYVCVASNDPSRPKAALRVALTVTPAP
ncbi:Serine protease, subtilase family [Lysobacter capsici AZ78]|uniref:Serine protease, subtilase family n=1 Tax=Lysobacter capsici AZ78 TaxID=1444315 RepID=A0A108U437_9GAMM|nr:S8 family serine peptidase [Lysobacter capsici]KWS02252.1 Serine protease, subtilase family [Lysobacter capsici AZ78]